MAGQTQGDKIAELEKLVATLVERVDNLRREKVDAAAFVRVEERLEQLRKDIDKASGKLWSFVQMVAAAVLGSALTFLVQLLLKRLG
jgi:hypothetical protein